LNLLYHAQHAEKYGLRIAEARADWASVMSWVHQRIDRIRGGTSEEAARDLSSKGIDVFTSEATFISPHELSISGKTVTAERIIIASGAKNVVPPIEGLHDVGFISNVEAVSLSSLPHRLAVVGGGAIGMEFAQMFHRFGVEVAVLEHGPQLLDKE